MPTPGPSLDWDGAALDDLSTVRQQDIDAARVFWQLAVARRDRDLFDGAGSDDEARNRAALEQVIAAGVRRRDTLTERLRTGALTTAAWQLDMARLDKAEMLCAIAAALGRWPDPALAELMGA